MKLSRFDKTVGLTLTVLVALTALFAWRGQQQGVTIMTSSPAPGTENVSTRTSIRVTFDQAMDIAQFGTKSFSALPLPLVIQPPVTGSVRWQQTTLTFIPSAPLDPEQLYTVTLAEELRSLQGRPFQGERQWQFRTRKASLLYLAPDQHTIMQLCMIDPVTILAQRLSQAASWVREYALSPDGMILVYIVSDSDHGSEIRLFDVTRQKSSRVLRCRGETCSHAVWSPDGTRLVYERTTSEEQVSRLWWLEVGSGSTVPVFEDPERFGSHAGWSPDGAWLSYIDQVRGELQVYHLKDGRHIGLPNQMGEAPVWHPLQNRLVFSDILFQDETMVIHLFHLDPEQEMVEDISGATASVEDWFPTWSPDGTWLACSRKVAGETMGKQLVMMRPDGSELLPLTNEPLFDHASPVWSPDDRYLAFQRSAVQDKTHPPEIWLIDLTNGQTQKAVTPGTDAVWLP